MSLLGKYAAVVPLDYHAGSAPSRKEDSVIYFNEDWCDLVKLIEAPLEFLRAEQFLWHQPTASTVDWQLIAPVSLTIMCGYADVEIFVNALSRMWPFFQARIPNITDATGLFESTSAMEKVVDLLAGSFMVEFNTYTSVARVLYFPPTARVVDEMHERGPLYTGGFMNPIIIQATGLGLMTSVLHLDLEDGSARARAEFLVNYMEDPQWFTDTLTGFAADGTMQKWTYELREASVPRTAPGGIKSGPEPAKDLEFAPGVPDPWPAPPVMTPFQEAVAATRMYPTVVSNNHSIVAGGSTCGHSACYTGSVFGSRKTHLGLMNLETYLRFAFDPQRMVADAVRSILGR